MQTFDTGFLYVFSMFLKHPFPCSQMILHLFLYPFTSINLFCSQQNNREIPLEAHETDGAGELFIMTFTTSGRKDQNVL